MKRFFLFFVLLVTAAVYLKVSPLEHFPARYRYRPAGTIEISTSIQALEARVNTARPSAFDLAELAGQYFSLGHLSGDFSLYDKAEATAQKSLTILPSPNPAKLILAKIADARHNFNEAIRISEECMKDKPGVGAISVIVSSYLAMGKLPEALKWADQAVDARPETGTFMQRALVLLAQGRDEEADYDFNRAVTVEDLGNFEESARLRSLWGRYLTSRGRFHLAEKMFNESLRILPMNHLALYLKGELEMRRGHWEKAQKEFMDAFVASKQTRYLAEYARAKQKAGQLQEANEYREKAEQIIRKELTQGGYGHRLELADILIQEGTPADLRQAIALALEETKIRGGAATYSVLARAQFLNGNLMDALTSIRSALASGVRNADYLALAAQIERARGNASKSDFYEKMAKELNPSFRREEKSIYPDLPLS